MEHDRKTDDSSTSQHLYMEKPRERVSFSRKQIPLRPFVASQNLSDDGEKKSISRKYKEAFEKELVMTSDQASMNESSIYEESVPTRTFLLRGHSGLGKEVLVSLLYIVRANCTVG
ncbi:hypothetical protein HYC85_003939 [Camellia sinensis]|uniref:Uncharacterized protein n=1 Tax=Camellia sinensis TaxID=4442 RepID=A0A7J7HXA1_CAMSI|nr:hypothetical protein HYC85_003939 [Camellia sinensis]